MNQLSQDAERYRQAYQLVIQHYWRETRRNWKNSVPGLLLPAIGSVFVLYIPALALSQIVETGGAGGLETMEDVLPWLGLFVGSWLLGEILWRLGINFAIKFEVHAVTDLYDKGLAQLLRHDLKFFHDNFAGSLTKRTIAYAQRYIDTLDTVLFNVSPNILPAIFALVVLSTYSVWLSVLLLVSMLGALAAVIPLIKKRRILVTARETASTVVSGHVADVYGNIEAVRAHAGEKREQIRHMTFVRDLATKSQLSWDFQNRRIDMIVSPIYVAVNASGLLLGLYLAQRDLISFSALIVVYAYYAQVTRFMWEFNGIYRRLETAISDAAQYTELLLTKPEIVDTGYPRHIPHPKGAISMENVHFSYEEGSRRLFTDFSLHIRAGEKVGLVGRSGGGKTSITKLLLRFSDIDEGVIKIDGVSISDLRQSELRSLISYVPQDPAMFHRSIRENIAYGRPGADEKAILDVARRAHAHEFVEDLPQGYRTLVGERGIKLSGGQRQRIAIARAMLKNAPILLLDEATSALDSESEKLIQDALWNLMQGKTAIVIAHRLSTIHRMDRIIVLDSGRIVEQGSHGELIRNGGVYSALWKHQSGGFLED